MGSTQWTVIELNSSTAASHALVPLHTNVVFEVGNADLDCASTRCIMSHDLSPPHVMYVDSEMAECAIDIEMDEQALAPLQFTKIESRLAERTLSSMLTQAARTAQSTKKRPTLTLRAVTWRPMQPSTQSM